MTTQHEHLVPDDDEIHRLLRQAEDLLGLVRAAEETSADEDPEPWTLPAPLAGGVATRALDRITDAVRKEVTPAHLTDTTPGPQLYAPDGKYEHTPLRLVKLDQTDVDTLTHTVQICHAAFHQHGDEESEHRWHLDELRDLLHALDLDSAPWPHGAPLNGEDKVTPLAQLSTLLNWEPDTDTRMLTEVLLAADGHNVVLTAEQESAYQRVADRLTTLLTNGDPLHRWQY